MARGALAGKRTPQAALDTAPGPGPKSGREAQRSRLPVKPHAPLPPPSGQARRQWQEASSSAADRPSATASRPGPKTVTRSEEAQKLGRPGLIGPGPKSAPGPKLPETDAKIRAALQLPKHTFLFFLFYASNLD